MTLLLQGGMAAATEPALGIEVLCRKNTFCHTTLMARLANAPFPYEGRVGESDLPFFDHTDPASGQRLHTVSEEVAYPEFPHYRDNRVLIHLPPTFRPEAPFEILVFFHGHHCEINRTLVEEMELLHQVNHMGRNLLLVAPQLALEAADSSPGKLNRPRGFDKLLKELSRVLGKRFGNAFSRRFDRAPVILAAFSGGYRTVAVTLDRGFAGTKQRDNRLRGVILVDALYGELDKFSAWLRHPKRRGFFVNLYGPSSAPLSRQLQQDATPPGRVWSNALEQRIKPGALYALAVETPHETIFLEGPPHWPLAGIIKQVEERRNRPDGKSSPRKGKIKNKTKGKVRP